MEKILSIVIPVYNIQTYLKECLDKLICNKKNYEIILINDGSTDDSLNICEAYTSKYSFIRLYSQPNKGVSVARNLGIEKAKGTYLYFIDGDDFLVGISSIIETIEQNEADLYAVNYNILLNGRIKYNKRYIESHHYSVYDFYALKGKNFHALWGFVFKRRIIEINNILFDQNLKYAEDWIFTINYLLHTKTVYTIPDSIYNYRLYRTGSAMSTPLSTHQLSLHFYAYNALSQLKTSSQFDYVIDTEKQVMMLYIINQMSVVTSKIRKECNSQEFIRKNIESYMFSNIGFKSRLKLLIAYVNIDWFALLKKISSI